MNAQSVVSLAVPGGTPMFVIAVAPHEENSEYSLEDILNSDFKFTGTSAYCLLYIPPNKGARVWESCRSEYNYNCSVIVSITERSFNQNIIIE